MIVAKKKLSRDANPAIFPKIDEGTKVVQFIANFLRKHSEECQFSLREILCEYSALYLSQRTILSKLQEIFRIEIMISNPRSALVAPGIPFRNMGWKILNKHLDNDEQRNIDGERKRLVETAGKFIKEQTRLRLDGNSVYDFFQTRYKWAFSYYSW